MNGIKKRYETQKLMIDGKQMTIGEITEAAQQGGTPA